MPSGGTPHVRHRKDPYKDTREEYESLLLEFQRLEAEQRALRCTEHSLLHVLDSLDVMCKAATLQASSQQHQDLNDQLAAAIVQQQEDDIAALLAGVGFPSNSTSNSTATSSGGNSSSAGSSWIKRVMLEHVAQASSMTAEQVTQRLAELAARLALQVIAHEVQHGPDAQTAQASAELVSDVDEYLGLMTQALLWGGAEYRDIVNTNLKTQQPFSEPLPAQWWLAVMQRVQLTDEQSEAVTALSACAYNRMELVRSELSGVAQQQAADTQRLEQALLQLKQLEQPAAAAAAVAVPDGAASAGASVSRAAAVRWDPTAGAAAEQGAQLLQQQNNLLRRLRLHTLHMIIAMGHIVTQFQAAVLISASFPSIPYLASAIAAWDEHIQQQRQQKLKQQQQKQRRRRQQCQQEGVQHE